MRSQHNTANLLARAPDEMVYHPLYHPPPQDFSTGAIGSQLGSGAFEVTRLPTTISISIQYKKGGMGYQKGCDAQYDDLHHYQNCSADEVGDNRATCDLD